MHCWKCKKDVGAELKVSFRTVCPSCGSDLHTCRGCRYYSPGKPNDCLVPGTEFIRDREAANFCEDFKINTDKQNEIKGGKIKFNSLFKDGE